jgi:alpha-tubulin suppressor-like RCC1 family protein
VKHLIISLLLLQVILPNGIIFAEEIINKETLTTISVESTQANLDAIFDQDENTTVLFNQEDTFTFKNITDTKKVIKFIQNETKQNVYQIVVEDYIEEVVPTTITTETTTNNTNFAPFNAYDPTVETTLDTEGNTVREYIIEAGTEWTNQILLDTTDVQLNNLNGIEFSSIKEIVTPITEPTPVVEPVIVEEQPIVEETPIITPTPEPIVSKPLAKTGTMSMQSMTMTMASVVNTNDYLNGYFDMYPITTPVGVSGTGLQFLYDNSLISGFSKPANNYTHFYLDVEKPKEINGMYINGNATAVNRIKVAFALEGVVGYPVEIIVSESGYVDLSAHAGLIGKKITRLRIGNDVLNTLELSELELFQTGMWNFPVKDPSLQNAYKPFQLSDRTMNITDAAFKACLNTKLGKGTIDTITKSQIDTLSGALDCSDKGIASLSGTEGFQTQIRDVVIAYGNESTLENATIFVITEDGKLYGWGYNAYGQIGNGTKTIVTTPTLINVGGKKVRKIVANGPTVLAIDEDFKIWSWGRGYQGALGHGDQTDRLVPTRIASIVGNVIDIGIFGVMFGGLVSNTTATSYAVVETATSGSGVVYSWGYDGSGQAGVGEDALNYYLTPQISKKANGKNLDNIAVISAGGSYAIAIDKWGRTWAWGNGEDGKLGRSSSVSSNVANEVDNIPPTKKVSTGNKTIHAITKDNEVYGWGHNSEGQLGDGTMFARYVPVRINLTNIADIRSGIYTTIALSYSNEAFVWGSNNRKQIIDSTETRILSPTLKDTNVSMVFLGARNAGYIKTDQTIYLGGNNLDGQFLEGDTTFKPTQPFRGMMRFFSPNITSVNLSKNNGINLNGIKGLPKATTVLVNETGLTDFSSLKFNQVQVLEAKNNKLRTIIGLDSLNYLTSVNLESNLLTTENGLSGIPNNPTINKDFNYIDNGIASSYTDSANKQYNFVIENGVSTETTKSLIVKWVHQGTKFDINTITNKPAAPTITNSNGNTIVSTWNNTDKQYEITVTKVNNGIDTLTVSMFNDYSKTEDITFHTISLEVDWSSVETLNEKLNETMVIGEVKTFDLPKFKVVDTSNSKNWTLDISWEVVAPTGMFESTNDIAIGLNLNGVSLNGTGSYTTPTNISSTVELPYRTFLQYEEGATTPKPMEIIYHYDLTITEGP